MNEFVVILKLINLKMGNWKIWKCSNPMVIKKISHSRSNLLSNTPKNQSKRIETEPSKWMQSKDP